MEEYGIMEYLELTVTRCGRWTGNREFIWSGLRGAFRTNSLQVHPGVQQNREQYFKATPSLFIFLLRHTAVVCMRMISISITEPTF